MPQNIHNIHETCTRPLVCSIPKHHWKYTRVIHHKQAQTGNTHTRTHTGAAILSSTGALHALVGRPVQARNGPAPGLVRL